MPFGSISGFHSACGLSRICWQLVASPCDFRLRNFADTCDDIRKRSAGKWHLNEVVITIGGKKQWLWRAVDQDGFFLDVFVQKPSQCQGGEALDAQDSERAGPFAACDGVVAWITHRRIFSVGFRSQVLSLLIGILTMAHTFNADRRDKCQAEISSDDLAGINESLRQRGYLIIWVKDEALSLWTARRRTSRSGQPKYGSGDYVVLYPARRLRAEAPPYPRLDAQCWR